MRALGIAALFLAAGASACINDRDTLAFEERNIDALARLGPERDPKKRADIIGEIGLKAISGRFERYPAKYYEMRIARLEAKSALTSPEDDDLAVAYERLGKTEKAIHLILASKPRRQTQEDWYRFHANYGTFLVHKWLASPMRAKDKSALKESIAQIEKALAIHPDSHFKREKYQLMLEKHWLDPDMEIDILSTGNDGENVVALAGIAMMGLGYELPDVYSLMGREWFSGLAMESTMRAMAQSRVVDLKSLGRHHVSEAISQFPAEGDPAEYAKLRANGQQVHLDRLAYMDARFIRNEHPDTHADFWKDWEEPSMPIAKRVPEKMIGPVAEKDAPIYLFLIGAGAILLAIPVALWTLLKRRRS